MSLIELEMVAMGELDSFTMAKPNTFVPEQVAQVLKAQGWTLDDFESEGFQYDWWMTFTKEDKSLRAAGCGYYGGFSIGAP